MKAHIFLVFCMLFATTAEAQNWPSFRGENASGVADGQNPPTSWNAAKLQNILWKTPIPGLGHSSPVIWGKWVFVTTAISSDPNSEFRHGLFDDYDSAHDMSKHTWRVYCLDKLSGKIRWERTASEGVPKTKRHIKSSHATPTVATDGKHLVVSFGSEGLNCYDLDGNLLWKQDLGVLDAGWFLDPGYQWGYGSSPIIFQNLVIVQCDIQKNSFIAAFDLNSGKQIWRTSREEIPSWGTPAIVTGKTRVELVTNATKYVRGYDPMTGRELWRLSGNPEITATTPLYAQDLIFICNSYHARKAIYAIRPGASGDISLKDGKESNDYVAWSKPRGGGVYPTPTPLVYREFLYVCTQHGILSCFLTKTGDLIYQERLAGAGTAYTASPIAADGKIYFTSEDGDVHVIKAGSKYELLSSNPVGEACIATPAISDGMILVRGQHHVFGIGERARLK